MIKLVAIVGATGTGKTDLGIHLAKKFSGEIINADSRQVYRGMDIGTAKPSEKDFGGVPHHLFNVVNPDQPWNAALFSAEADRLISEIISRKKQPFVVGGTGLHVKALLYGLFAGPPASKEVRERLEKTPDLYGKLLKIDPVTATRVHPNDPVRIIRALEVFELTGKPISAHQEEHGFAAPRYQHLKIGLKMDRDKLRKIIEARVEGMIKRGLEGEVKGLLQKWGENPLLARAIGYKEWFDYFKNKKSREVVIEQVVIATRQFAKRQEAWFKYEKDIFWFENTDREGIEKLVGKFTRLFEP